MAIVIQYTDDPYNCIKRYVVTSLDYVRMIEHKLTEVLELLEELDKK